MYGAYGGDFVNFKTSADEQVWAFHRKKNGDKIVAILNLSPKSASFSINDPALAGQYTDVLTDESHELEAKESVTMNPWAYWLLEAR
jgi:hypothetical protein